MPVARNKYVVTHTADFMRESHCEPTREVYADQITMTPTGDVVFHQVRKSSLVNDKGERNLENDMVIVLVLKSNTIAALQLVTPTGGIAFTEAGVVDLAH